MCNLFMALFLFETVSRSHHVSIPLNLCILILLAHLHALLNKSNRYNEALRELSFRSAAAHEPSVRAIMGRITNNPASSYLITGKERQILVQCEDLFSAAETTLSFSCSSRKYSPSFCLPL